MARRTRRRRLEIDATEDTPERAEVDQLVETLRGFGVLTRARLGDRSGAESWPDHRFESALRHGVAEGRIKKLGDDLFELGDAERDRG
jgi:hypothetical protein